MSHELSFDREGARFAFNSENGDPWHALGTPVRGYMTIDAAMAASRTDFLVEEAPAFAMIDGQYVEDKRSKMTWRKSPKTGGAQILGNVGIDYQVVQNRRAVELALSVVNAAHGDAVIDTMGELFDGRRFFASIDLGALFIDPRGVNDEIRQYVGVLTGHDGSLGLSVYNDDTRPVCANTVTAGIYCAKLDKAVKRYVSFRHTTNIEELAKQGVQTLAVAQAWAEAFADAAETLLRAPGGLVVLEKVLDHPQMFPKVTLDDGATERQVKFSLDTRDQIFDLYGRPTNAPRVGDNGWAIFNTIGEYLDHHRGGKADNRAVAAMTPNSWVDKKKKLAAELITAGV